LRFSSYIQLLSAEYQQAAEVLRLKLAPRRKEEKNYTPRRKT